MEMSILHRTSIAFRKIDFGKVKKYSILSDVLMGEHKMLKVEWQRRNVQVVDSEIEKKGATHRKLERH